jgi:cytochrome c-type biogenesis protein CcmF
MWQSLPEFGTGLLYAVLVTAAYTFALGVAAGRGRPRLLQSARLGAYATCALIALGVVLLAYAFITHDFRIRYVARYSDRSMSTGYLFAALWGGQDGSLLWWAFLLSLYVGGCVRWMKGRYRPLQPYVIATLMVIIAFFAVLMIFAANPFGTGISGARPDGEGLNPLLQNYWMIIHPPALYMGFVGCAIPFAFAIAALITGRLDNEWIIAVRKWMLFAWLFLSIGNVLGMIWAYEELGWGGYWGWDPVENAACLPWFTASAYVHSTMIQERRNMLKVWNVFLICLTFLLTIFGTFLTRSGLIASVHSFAQSNIGIFFVWFMGLTIAACAGLIIWRLPQLRGRAQIEAVASREAMFVVNNWALLGGMVFILIATMFPKISELLWSEKVTVGPTFFNRWMAPIGLVIFLLMGLAPLFGWRKTSGVSLKRAFAAPLIALLTAGALHFLLGKQLGFPALVPVDPTEPSGSSVLPKLLYLVARALDPVRNALPVIAISLSAFNVAVIVQEFVRGVRARRKAADRREDREPLHLALYRLIERSRRRYGGYVVHLGIVAMFIGFTGRAWGVDAETSLAPGQSHQVGDYTLTYEGTRREVDTNKMMILADLAVSKDGRRIGTVTPGKFIYKRMPSSPTTEVAIHRTLRDDLYVVLGNVNADSKRATFQFHVNPLVNWIWIGTLILILGASVSLWPELAYGRVGAWAYIRAAATGVTGCAVAFVVASAPAQAYAQPETRAPPGSWRSGDVAPTVMVGAGAAPVVGIALGALFARRRSRRDEKHGHHPR